MKKAIFISLFCIGLFTAASAQTGTFSQTASNPTGAITNTSVDTMTYTSAKAYPIVSIQPVVTKASGTMTGWAVLDYSVNGTNWVVGSDTVTLTNVTTNTGIITKQVGARYFRLRVGGATTVTGTAAAKIGAVAYQ
jgi:hypothetical protein